MNDRGIVALGIPVPLSSPVFLSIVAIHVAAGLVCVVAGVAAMLSAKRAGRHPFAGSVYHWSLLVLFLSMTALGVSLTREAVVRRGLGPVGCAGLPL